MSTTPIATVQLVDLGRHHAPFADELEATFRRVLGAGAFTLGAEVAGFETEFAEYCGVDHCVGVASGTAALAVTFSAAGIGPGDEVMVPAHTFIASALGVVHAGATPVFCDVDPETGLIDPAAAESVIGPRTAAILPVHLYGQACDMAALGALAHRHGLLVVEDAAQAHGARFQGRRVGSLAAAGCFSFYPSKNLGALGNGGAICTDDAQLAERARQLRNLGQRNTGEHVVLGYNERLDGLQAALLRVKLPRLDGWNRTRRDHAERYQALLGGELTMLSERPESPCVFHLFPVRVPDRDAFRGRLIDQRVQAGVHYSPSLPDQPPLSGARGGPWPEARAWAAEQLSLPMFAELTDDELVRVAEACRAAAAHTVAGSC